jgi:predicted DNA-binding antitoxin AbrB/MazE fold protein
VGETIIAIYEGGILRPLVPLHLPEHAQVQVRIITGRRDGSAERQRVREALLAAGVIRPRPPVKLPSVVSEEQLMAAANALAKAGPLSELILAEREQR